MAASNARFTFAGASPTNGNFVAATVAAPDNCTCVAVRLKSTFMDSVLVGCTPSAVGDAAVDMVNAITIEPGGSFDWPIGVKSVRGASFQLLYASTGGAIDVDIVYVNELGGQ